MFREVSVMEIRRFHMGDANALSALIRRTLVEVNSVDCPKEEISFLYELYTPEKVIHNAETGHTYVLEEDGVILGTGTILATEQAGESEIVAAFLAPEAIGRGCGRHLFEALESDPLFTGAERVWLTSSITALKFYEKMGYTYEGGHCHKNEDDLIVMEKFPARGSRENVFR